MRIIRDDFPMGESTKAAHKSLHGVWGHVDTVFRNEPERRKGWRNGVPIQLRVDPARPLDDRIPAGWIVERTDENVGARRVGAADRGIHIRYKITRPL